LSNGHDIIRTARGGIVKQFRFAHPETVFE
jgi:hypothetical protein